MANFQGEHLCRGRCCGWNWWIVCYVCGKIQSNCM